MSTPDRFILAVLAPSAVVLALLLTACQDVGDDDSGDASTSPQTEGIQPFPDPTTGDDTGETTTDVSSSTTDSSTEGSTTDGCYTFGFELMPSIPRVMLVLDKSGSMVANPDGYWDHDGDPATSAVTRWRSLHETVEFIVTDFEERMAFGAVLFPAVEASASYDAHACLVHDTPDVAISVDQSATILATIPPANTVNIRGGTPAAAGVLTAIAGLATDNPEEAERPQYLILVTDGAANCPIEPVDDAPKSLFEIYDDQLPIVVANANANAIGTFVVGIDIQDTVSGSSQDGNPDDTNTFEQLNLVATAGGQAREGAEKFYNTTNQLELQAALMKISEIITECTLDLNNPLPNSVYIDELELDPDGDSPLVYGQMQVQDCDTESGWHFTDESRSAIELCGAACTLYKQTGDVNIVVECPIF